MRNVVFLALAIVLFAVAYYVYAMVAVDHLAGPATRSMRGPTGADGGDALRMFIEQYQPYLTLASSLGGIASFLVQVRIWMRGRPV
ncbi:MAG: hypothetical protein KKB37_15920 [Alphaproteobacteria bacterium]|nr:hypothetical protein [Alphaproteobacteria bacterium]